MKTRTRSAVLLLVVTLLAPLLLSACGRTVSNNIDDATISTRVKTVLLNDPDVGGLRIDVATFNGVVTLSGTVRAAADGEKAVTMARRINGVSDVKNLLKVQ